MGLDISAYSQLTKIDAEYNEEYECIDRVTREAVEDYFRAYINSDFPGRADDVEHGAFYASEDAFGFRAGSYGGYNQWRDWLAKLAGYPEQEFDDGYTKNRKSHCVACWNGQHGPFAELIHFSDCEGVIGAVVSAKLAKDFADFQSKVDVATTGHDDEDDYMRRKYAEWRKAFEMASNNGAVAFH